MFIPRFLLLTMDDNFFPISFLIFIDDKWVGVFMLLSLSSDSSK